MNAPLSEFGVLGPRGVIVAGFGIGVAFGVCLERAGLGSAKKLMGQFTLKDLTVFKVMFSAIITAMLGLFWLSWLGVLDPSRVYVPETFLLPQLLGGIIFGIGFAVAGLCPGTSCVAAITGRGDGVATVVGMFIGVLATGVALPAIQQFYTSSARGSLALPRLLGLSEGTVVLLVVGIALAGFAIAPLIEQRASAAE